ncbi:CHASE domain-containing sensor histidine kinase [Oceanobacter mangrovi]|uniref:CHASE domain-containing sensor histidine kinase n=1 Tax=Oceanobacter mangrovi TaxID=2862510 RepID=UPI001C8EAE34|nr:CHASE domain-containing protein [Oceanobacter mangrovi]
MQNSPAPLASDVPSTGRLHWYHWAVLVLSLILTVSAWYISAENAEQKSRALFEYQASQIIDLVQERMAKYEEALWAGVATLNVKDEFTRSDWKKFADTLHIQDRYPGINGIGVIHYVPPAKKDAYLSWLRLEMPDYTIHPEHSNPEFWPIAYIEPQSDNLKAVGLDVAHEANRYNAALKARKTASVQITGPITLVQDTRKTPGFLFYAPWFSQDSRERLYGKGNFLGLVYSPFIMHKLMGGTLANSNRQVNFSIADGEVELYNELTERSENYDASPLFTTRQTIELYGREWTFVVQSSTLFRNQQNHVQPWFILAGGILIDSMLLLIFVVLGRSRQNAIDYSHQVTRDLRVRQQELELARERLQQRNNELLEANKELDQFAFVASHDLKGPLRGIGQLAGWIEDDLRGTLSAQTRDYLDLLKGRIQRLESLLDGLLGYSRIGRDEGKPETFIIADRIRELFVLLAPPESFSLVCDDKVGEITTLSAPFDQVMRNLMANALKHHDKAFGTLKVKSWAANSKYYFSVSDDGPGIPQKYQDAVFELFHTLKPRDEVEGSGLGLAIVKKIVERYDGHVYVQSDGKRGTSFVFDWPSEIKPRRLSTKDTDSTDGVVGADTSLSAR